MRRGTRGWAPGGLLTLAAILATGCAPDAPPAAPEEVGPAPTARVEIATDRAPEAIGPYAQGVLVGNTLYRAGQIALDPESGEMVGGGDIEAEARQVMENLGAVLDAAGFDYMPSRQIVLTGGASQIPGLDGLATRILGQQVRLGRPIRVHGLPQMATGPAFSGLVGLCMYAAHPQDEWWDFDIPADRFAARPLKRAIRWFRDNW